MEPIVSQWLERALADEQGRALLRAALHKNELPVIDLDGQESTHDPQVVQA